MRDAGCKFALTLFFISRGSRLEIAGFGLRSVLRGSVKDQKMVRIMIVAVADERGGKCTMRDL